MKISSISSSPLPKGRGFLFQVKSTRRFDNDTREWVHNNSLNCQYSSIFLDADFYIIKHWLYCCCCTPAFEIFFEKQDLEDYITKSVKAGDYLEIWSISGDKMKYIEGKVPDENGLIPLKGAY